MIPCKWAAKVNVFKEFDFILSVFASHMFMLAASLLIVSEKTALEAAAVSTITNELVKYIN